MEQLVSFIQKTSDSINNFVLGPIMLTFILLVGIWFSVKTNFFQVTKFHLWFSKTFLAIFTNKNVTKTKDSDSITQFQALSTALAATIGTGNIVGVATAIVLGGPGAVFWMWISAFLGMMTSYAENVLGVFYRQKNHKNEWIGGPMIYIEKGLKCKWLACLFSVFCVFASFGIGNMTQANSVADAVNTYSKGDTWRYLNLPEIPTFVSGIIMTLIIALVILGGIKRIAKVTEKFVPFMALGYTLGSIIIIWVNSHNILNSLNKIIIGAFDLRAVGGGFAGTVIAQAIRYGVARGVFSNEAGLGSSVIVNAASNVKEPVTQGMWGIFQVFVDTIVMCSLTALCILTSGALESGEKGIGLSIFAFSSGFGDFGGLFITVSIILFAFSTIIGWSYYGEKAIEYLFGLNNIIIYRIIYICLVFVGSTANLDLVWGLSDTFNGLMAVVNLTAITLLSKKVFDITKNYLKRRKTGDLLE